MACIDYKPIIGQREDGEERKEGSQHEDWERCEEHGKCEKKKQKEDTEGGEEQRARVWKHLGGGWWQRRKKNKNFKEEDRENIISCLSQANTGAADICLLLTNILPHYLPLPLLVSFHNMNSNFRRRSQYLSTSHFFQLDCESSNPSIISNTPWNHRRKPLTHRDPASLAERRSPDKPPLLFTSHASGGSIWVRLHPYAAPICRCHCVTSTFSPAFTVLEKCW